MNPAEFQYIDIKKPSKPIKSDRKMFSYKVLSDENQNTAEVMQKKVNYLMEMMKFFPEYERMKFQGSNATNKEKYEKELQKYGMTFDQDGNEIPDFGQAYQTGSETEAARQGHLSKIEEMQIEGEAAGDFYHFNDEDEYDNFLDSNEIYQPQTKGLSAELFGEVTKGLENEKRSYYELMKEGLSGYSDKQAFYLMVSMLESRTRGMKVFKEIFGDPKMRADRRLEHFKNWRKEMGDDVKPWKIGFLSFFLDIEQAYFNRINPLFGKSTAGLANEKDKVAAEKFFADLTEKIENLIKTEPHNASEIKALWQQWQNGDDIPGANSQDLRQDWANKQIIEILDQDFDKIVTLNITVNAMNRRMQRKYKDEKEEYQEKLEERQLEEVAMKKAESKKKAQDKKIENQNAAKARANEKRLNKATLQAMKKGRATVRRTAGKAVGKIKAQGKRLAKIANKKLASPLAKKIAAKRAASRRISGKVLQPRFIKNINASRKRIKQAGAVTRKRNTGRFQKIAAVARSRRRKASGVPRKASQVKRKRS